MLNFGRKDSSKPIKVLVVKPDHLGDFTLSLPSLWEMTRFFKGSSPIRVMVHPLNASWSSILPWLPELQVLRYPRYDWGEKKLSYFTEIIVQMLKLRKEFFTIGINLTSARNDPWGKYLLQLAGCRQIIAPRYELPDKELQGLHETQRIAIKLPKEWGITGQSSPEIFIPSDLRHKKGKVILLAPSTRAPAKSWPAERWRKLMLSLPTFQTRVLIPNDDSGKMLSNWVPVEQQCPVQSIEETLRLLANSAVVVCPDTAVAHFGWLVGTPVIQIFSGVADPVRWKSLGAVAMLREQTWCSPCKKEECFQSRHLCMDPISVENVLAEIGEVLKKGG